MVLVVPGEGQVLVQGLSVLQALFEVPDLYNKKGKIRSTAITHCISRSSSDCLRLDYPITRNKAGDRTFTVYASKLWNNLPMTVRNCTSVNAFKKALKTHLFPNYLFSLMFIFYYVNVYYFFTSVSALNLLGMAYQILVVCMYVCTSGMIWCKRRKLKLQHIQGRSRGGGGSP